MHCTARNDYQLQMMEDKEETLIKLTLLLKNSTSTRTDIVNSKNK